MKSRTGSYSVYMMTNKGNRVLYVGFTNDLPRRVMQHRNKLIEGITSRYNVTKLVYYESLSTLSNARAREKQIKG